MCAPLWHRQRALSLMQHVPPPPRAQWFQSLHPQTPLAWALSALLLASLGVAHEALGSYRSALARRQRQGAAAGAAGGLGHAYAPMPAGGGGGGGLERAPAGARLLHSGLYGLNLATGYLLMLAVGGARGGCFLVVASGWVGCE
jgi:hypothetical protein